MPQTDAKSSSRHGLSQATPPDSSGFETNTEVPLARAGNGRMVVSGTAQIFRKPSQRNLRAGVRQKLIPSTLVVQICGRNAEEWKNWKVGQRESGTVGPDLRGGCAQSSHRINAAPKDRRPPGSVIRELPLHVTRLRGRDCLAT